MEWNSRQVELMEALCRLAGIPVSIDRFYMEDNVASFDDALTRLTQYDMQRLQVVGEQFHCAGVEHAGCKTFEPGNTQLLCSHVTVALVEVALHHIGREWKACLDHGGDMDSFSAWARKHLDDASSITGVVVPHGWIDLAKGLASSSLGEYSRARATIEKVVREKFAKKCSFEEERQTNIPVTELAMSR